MVNWDAVGAVSEALGAVVVMASLVYVALQVKHANRQVTQANLQAQGSAHAEWYIGWNDIIRGWTRDRDTVQIMQRGFDSFDNLPSVEQAIFAQQMAALINHWALAADLADRQLLQDSVRDGAGEIVVSVCSTRGGRTFLETNHTGFPRGSELLGLVESGRGSLPPFDVLAPWWSARSDNPT